MSLKVLLFVALFTFYVFLVSFSVCFCLFCFLHAGQIHLWLGYCLAVALFFERFEPLVAYKMLLTKKNRVSINPVIPWSLVPRLYVGFRISMPDELLTRI